MITGESYTVHIGNNLDILPTLADNSMDSIVTDPPYELGFMGKKWDSSGIAYSVELWRECLRVLKPGGHLLSFGGTRTWHRVAVGIEDAGFEVRDSIAWMYGSGFPKSLDVSKAINKTAGVEYEAKPASGVGFMNSSDDGYNTTLNQLSQVGESTPEAKQWEGWGTALKPAFEPIVVARKPLIGTVAANVLEHGTGALNIDGSRIMANDQEKLEKNWNRNQSIAAQEGRNSMSGGLNAIDLSGYKPQGRWPANVILDEYSAELLDEQSGTSKSPTGIITQGGKAGGGYDIGSSDGTRNTKFQGHGDSGGASRFFYVAKASKRDRNEGLEDLDPQRHSDREKSDGAGGENPRNRTNEAKQNFHPTVKPTQLMRYLVKLVTPPGGTVLDPFTGSGSTGKAAILEGFRFIGCELTEDYIPILEGRLKHAELMKAEEEAKQKEALF
jgi:site-specific DNA-methyltransferase (adenine-specific)